MAFRALEKSVIKDADGAKLEEFLYKIMPLLPTNLYDFRDSRLDHMVISYKIKESIDISWGSPTT